MYEGVYRGDSAAVSHSPQRAFGPRIRDLRQQAGLTQEDLAHHCGLFRTYLSRIENGKANPTLTMIHALAVSLDVPVTALFESPPGPSRSKAPAARATQPASKRIAK